MAARSPGSSLFVPYLFGSIGGDGGRVIIPAPDEFREGGAKVRGGLGGSRIHHGLLRLVLLHLPPARGPGGEGSARRRRRVSQRHPVLPARLRGRPSIRGGLRQVLGEGARRARTRSGSPTPAGHVPRDLGRRRQRRLRGRAAGRLVEGGRSEERRVG